MRIFRCGRTLPFAIEALQRTFYIEKYIHECYDGKGIKGSSPKTTFIAYGADLTLSKLADDDEKLVSWYKEKGLTKKGYYLVVGRFVPENSFEVMIREFMKSKSKKDFGWYYNALHERNGDTDPARIVIGKDTRRSSYMFEYSLVAGLTASGADAYLLHVTTTPCGRCAAARCVHRKEKGSFGKTGCIAG